MAVDDSVQGQGYGSAILAGLEAEAKRFGALRIVLNARDNAIKFYEKHGYATTSGADTLFESVRHVRMAKTLH